MTKAKLEKKHRHYEENVRAWTFFNMAYEGGEDFINEVIRRNERESLQNFLARKQEAVDFNHASAVVDLFNFYLTEKKPAREMGGVDKMPQWRMFEKDCDLQKTDFNAFVNQAQKFASIFGVIGILVNKSGSAVHLEQEVRKRIYPYCVAYTPPNIYDWEYERNPETHRFELSRLKLYEEDDRYLIWTRESWEIWRIRKSSAGSVTEEVELEDQGENALGEIPFVWMANVRMLNKPYAGISDLKEIARITASIVRNISCGEEIIKWAGFPMLAKPFERGLPEDESEKEDVVGVQAVQEFDPELGESGKPSWIEPKVAEPIGAILDWIELKERAIYQTVHLGGVVGQRTSDGRGSSGVSIRYQFQQLNSVLLQKMENMSEAEKEIIRFWLKWQGKEDAIDKVDIKRVEHFSIDDLSVDLENIFTTMRNVISPRFKAIAQVRATRKVFPDISESDANLIEKEVNDLTTPDYMGDKYATGKEERDRDDVRTAAQSGKAGRASGDALARGAGE